MCFVTADSRETLPLIIGKFFAQLLMAIKRPSIYLEQIGKISRKVARKIRDNDGINEILEESAAEWEIRKKLWPGVETDQTKKLDKVGREAGAKFSRVCGAGGGGVMAFFCAPDKRSDLNEALESAGGEVLFFKREHGRRTQMEEE